MRQFSQQDVHVNISVILRSGWKEMWRSLQEAHGPQPQEQFVAVQYV
jgi:hypothetical protein